MKEIQNFPRYTDYHSQTIIYHASGYVPQLGTRYVAEFKDLDPEQYSNYMYSKNVNRLGVLDYNRQTESHSLKYIFKQKVEEQQILKIKKKNNAVNDRESLNKYTTTTTLIDIFHSVVTVNGCSPTYYIDQKCRYIHFIIRRRNHKIFTPRKIALKTLWFEFQLELRVFATSNPAVAVSQYLLGVITRYFS